MASYGQVETNQHLTLDNTCFTLMIDISLFVQTQLLMSILNDMRNAAQTKNNFMEVHLNGIWLVAVCFSLSFCAVMTLCLKFSLLSVHMS